MPPKVFISYSWSSPAHQSLVLQWAEQLFADGIDVVLDVYDLKEGQDKFAFMERMVTDDSVTNVLIICDKVYAEKADERKAGVGTESQIISKEVYEKVEQSKFVPIVCEFSDDGEPCLPAFLKSRIWIDFSSPEAVNENWERLVRHLYGKPLHEKPQLGEPPAYITNDVRIPPNPATTKFNVFRQALLNERKGLVHYRRDFLSACISFADELRVRERPDEASIAQKIFEDCGKLKPIRNNIIDWVLLESEISPSESFCEALLLFLEELLELKARPPEVDRWNETWSEAHTLFVYETFLYIVAALLKTNSYKILHEVFTSRYLLPKTQRYSANEFTTFESFYGYSHALQTVLAPEGKKLHSPAAELIKRQADRKDIPFLSIIEGELLVLLMALISPDATWYPQTFYYAPYNEGFPFFTRATQHRYFEKLVIITGIDDADALRVTARAGLERLGAVQWQVSRSRNSFWSLMNMEKLDSLK